MAAAGLWCLAAEAADSEVTDPLESELGFAYRPVLADEDEVATSWLEVVALLADNKGTVGAEPVLVVRSGRVTLRDPELDSADEVRGHDQDVADPLT